MADPHDPRQIAAPMPGMISTVSVKNGDTVAAGQKLLSLEAMKMENSLRATDDVTVKKILAEQGQSLVVDQPIIEFG